MNKIICIAGPTASGKTALAVEMAKITDGEVVSCDSMQIYKGMDIGTAKPTKEEQQGIVHHMIDIAHPWEDYSVSCYCETATPIIEDILARGKTAIIAGGTGLYMDALIRGNCFAPAPSTGMREKLEAQANNDGIESMLALLNTIDPTAASQLHLKDRKRILRALEVFYETGETITEHNKRTQSIPPRFTPIWFALEDEQRSALYERINNRVVKMLSDGLLEEIRSLLNSGIPEKCTAMQAIGYKEYIHAINGQCTIEDATAQVQQASRHYAKRQLTWFRRNPEIHWLRRKDGEKTQEILMRACQVLTNFDK